MHAAPAWNSFANGIACKKSGKEPTKTKNYYLLCLRTCIRYGDTVAAGGRTTPWTRGETMKGEARDQYDHIDMSRGGVLSQ